MPLCRADSKFCRFLPFCQLLSLCRAGFADSSVASCPSERHILPGLLSVILLTIYKMEATGYQQVTLNLRLDRQVLFLEEERIVMAYFTMLSVRLSLSNEFERI